MYTSYGELAITIFVGGFYVATGIFAWLTLKKDYKAVLDENDDASTGSMP
ncbi:MAG: hypothetical protein LBK04_06240 [Clostridiales Family XIII bacterium]|jgi:hypothetical protein|nr:hypothetical protein [Clostridiales Family XIII bacterium]